MPLPDRMQFNCPVKLICGRRALEHIPYELATRNACRPLLLSDENAHRENRSRAFVDALRETDQTLGLVEALPAKASREIVSELAAIYRDRDHDALVVMGAGPLMDMAKTLNLVVSTGQDDPGAVTSDMAGMASRLKPMVLIAPAAASAYEASGRASIHGADLRAVGLMPDLVCIDERTLGAPGQEALMATGITALALGAETVMARPKNPMGDIYGVNAVQMAVAALHAVERLPDAVTPRMHLAGAAVMAGCALADRAPGRMERIARRLAATGRTSYSEALGILLPAAADFGERHWDWSPADLLRALVGLDRAASTPPAQQAMSTASALKTLVNDLFCHTAGRIPRVLDDAGFTREELDSVAASVETEDRAIAPGAIARLFQAAWGVVPDPARQ